MLVPQTQMEPNFGTFSWSRRNPLKSQVVNGGCLYWSVRLLTSLSPGSWLLHLSNGFQDRVIASFPNPSRLMVDRYPHDGLQHPRWRNARGLDEFIKGAPHFSVDVNSDISSPFVIFHFFRFPPPSRLHVYRSYDFLLRPFSISIQINFSSMWRKERV